MKGKKEEGTTAKSNHRVEALSEEEERRQRKEARMLILNSNHLLYRCARNKIERGRQILSEKEELDIENAILESEENSARWKRRALFSRIGRAMAPFK